VTSQQLIMTLLKSTAKKHGFVCLLHEKPFAGINGSGKHVNWSVGNATQGNLLDPGDTPHANMQFLLFCGAVIRGVHKYVRFYAQWWLLPAMITVWGQMKLLPPLFPVYLGSQLEKVFDQISQRPN
jgi:glutamine synthetase